jgi:hypothetical protein
MKNIAAIYLSALLITGCCSNGTRKDAFASLHNQIERRFGARANCGTLIPSAAVRERSFEIGWTNSGCRILVFERDFLTQKEWDRRYSASTKLFNEFTTMITTNHDVNAQTAQRFAGTWDFLFLPNWSYKGIGLDVNVQCPEIAYPGLETESEAAERFLKEVVSLLRPYRRANKTL